MAHTSSRRWRATLVLAAALLVLALPAARAAERPTPHRAASRIAAGPGLVSTLWNALARLWSPEGSGLDPHGIITTGDAGGGLDPNGRTHATNGEEGGGLDPSGRQ